MKKTTLKLFLVSLFFLIPSYAYAAIPSQLLNDAHQDGQNAGAFFALKVNQTLGQDWSGTVNSITLLASGADNPTYVNIFECTSSLYDDCVDPTTDGNIFFDLPGGVYNEQEITAAFTPFTFDPAKYYFFRVFNDQSDNVPQLFGTVTDVLNMSIQCPLNGNTCNPSGFPDLTELYFYFGSDEPPTPSTQFNEVVRYWPSLNVATSSGTTTVGAQFSVPEPTWIDYAGYRLYKNLSPTFQNNFTSQDLLFHATTTVNEPSLFSITTDYNFTVPPTRRYVGIAYFVQNGVEIPTARQQLIIIDSVIYTVGDDGEFIRSTAAGTTTINSLFATDCGEFDGAFSLLIGPVCDFAVWLFIPSSDSFQGLQRAFDTILLGFPFSLYNEARVILTGISPNATQASQGLNLTLYGQTVPVITASTSDSVGFGQDQRNLLANLINAALWAFLLFYLYMRGAHWLEKIRGGRT